MTMNHAANLIKSHALRDVDRNLDIEPISPSCTTVVFTGMAKVTVFDCFIPWRPLWVSRARLDVNFGDSVVYSVEYDLHTSTNVGVSDDFACQFWGETIKALQFYGPYEPEAVGVTCLVRD